MITYFFKSNNNNNKNNNNENNGKYPGNLVFNKGDQDVPHEDFKGGLTG